MLDAQDHKQVRNIVREETLDLRAELTRIGLLVEDIDSTLATVLELLVINLDVKMQVEDHEPRITKLETNHTLFADTLRSHSRKLKTRKELN